MRADGVDHRLQRLALAGQGDPADQLAHPLGMEGVEHGVDHVALAGLAAAALADRFGDRCRDGRGNILGQCAVEPGDAAEMVEQVGVGPADLGGDGLQGHGRNAFVAQQLARRGHRCGAAFVGRKAFTSLQCY